MKRFELFFTVLQLPLDFAMLLLAGVSAYTLRFSGIIRAIRPVLFAQNLSWEKYFPVVAIVAIGWLVIFAFSGLYRFNPNRKLARDITRIILACSTGFAAITIFVFFTLSKFDSRFLVLAGWLFATLYVVVGRLFLQLVKLSLYRAGVGLRRTALFGSGDSTRALSDTLTRTPGLGYQVAATFSHFDAAAAAAISAHPVDEILFADPVSRLKEALAAIDFANEHQITFKYSADLFTTLSTNMSIATVAGVPIVELRQTRLMGWGRVAKRLMDIIGSLLFMVIFSPLYLLLAIVVLIETGRPVIYKNERVGQFGQKFITLKFRSMYQKDSTGAQFGSSGEAALLREQKLIKTNGSKSGPVYKIKNDPRVTPVGTFLRRWSLDELPQFWNVLRGDMSLVGPRPHQPREVAGYNKAHRILFAIKPGITGLAQISGRSDLTFDEEAKLDTFYVENWSIYMDIIVLLKTPFVVLRKKGAW